MKAVAALLILLPLVADDHAGAQKQSTVFMSVQALSTRHMSEQTIRPGLGAVEGNDAVGVWEGVKAIFQIGRAHV